MPSHDQLAKMIDFALLEPTQTQNDIVKNCILADHHHVASVFVLPYWTGVAAEQLACSDVKVGTVIGFPLGATTTDAKEFEARRAIADGAQELDMVINIGQMKAGNYDEVRRDIEAVVNAAQLSGFFGEGQEVLVQVTLETCYLTESEKVRACRLAMGAEAEFVNTSTGFGMGGATVEDIRLMRNIVGPDLGVKATGGICTLDKALDLLAAGANRISTSSLIEIL